MAGTVEREPAWVRSAHRRLQRRTQHLNVRAAGRILDIQNCALRTADVRTDVELVQIPVRLTFDSGIR